MMEIIKCKCGYYKQLNDELCPKCGADYSAGDEYEILDDQETAYMRWVNLGEKGFNEYMEAASQPHFMICPQCRFKMLITEKNCPKCGTPVKFVLDREKSIFSLPERFFMRVTKIMLWVGFIGIIVYASILLLAVLLG